MKKTIALTLLTFTAGLTARAQWVVYDPAVHTQQILNQVEDVAKFVEMINNQVQQIQRLQSQLQEFQHYNQAFGDPSRIVQVTGATGLVRDLRRTPVGGTIADVQRVADGVEALTYDANGLYRRIGPTFRTPSGKEVEREPVAYKPHEAVNKTTQNYTNVTAEVLQRRKGLKDEIAATTEKLQSANTASEVQKLTGVMIGLNAALSATDKELDHATTLALVQDIENRNDADKQVRARREEQKAELLETFGNYRATFQLNTQPPLFPEGR